MFQKRLLWAAAAVVCVLSLCGDVSAVEVEADSSYCFRQEDFAPEEPLVGICILELPDPATGTVLLGSRVLRPGDILTVQQLEKMTFAAVKTEQDVSSQVGYLPIYENRVAPCAAMPLSVRGKENKAPVAEDSALETYKNLPNTGKLKATDPEGEPLTYTVTRQPKRGTLSLQQDGSFEYTPKKNKVGVDSFTYTATDPAGNVSREATVTLRIMKPADVAQYTDMEGSDCRFAAEWMKNTGLFVGERLGGSLCFHESKPVSRGEFLTMLVSTLKIPVDEALSYSGYTDQIPSWLKPYLAAAMRAGLTAGLPGTQEGVFGAEQTITGAEAAVMMNNAMELAVSASSMDELNDQEPAWAIAAVTAMNENGFAITAGQELTRGQVAQLLYRVSQMAKDIPGLAMYQ